jgi:tetratricopeptide (TPR) repeat protein
LEYFLCSIRNLEKAKDIINLLEQKMSILKNIPSLIMARYYILIASYVSWVNKDYNQGIEVINKAKKLLSDAGLPPEDTLMVYNRLTENYYLLGDTEQATMYSDKSEKLIKETNGFLGNKDAFYNARARILVDQGDLLQAEFMLGKAIEEIRRYSKKDDSLGVIFVRLSQIALMKQRGAIKESYQDMKELEQVFPALFDLEKPHYIKAFAHILYSEIALSNGKIQEASQKINTSIKMLKEIKEVNTRFNTMALIAEADILKAKNLYEKAQSNYLLAAKWYKANLKKPQIYKVAELYSKLVINSVLLKDVINAKKYFSSLKKDFGIQHKITVETVKMLNDMGVDIP